MNTGPNAVGRSDRSDSPTSDLPPRIGIRTWGSIRMEYMGSISPTETIVNHPSTNPNVAEVSVT